MKKLLSLGVDGGGFDVFEMANKTIVESGSSGGILDEDEDPMKNWNKKFETLEDWWRYFTTNHSNHWICFSLSFIDVSVKEFVLQKVTDYDSSHFEADYHKNEWLYRINDNK